MKYSFSDLTASEMNVIAEALGNMPYRLASPIIAKLQEQITAQEAAAKESNVIELPTKQEG